MKLSQTPRGARWVANFADDDKATARLLADSLTIETQSAARPRLRALIAAELEVLRGPVWILPVMGEGDIKRVYRNVSNDQEMANERIRQSPLVAFDDLRPGTLLDGNAGSEAWVANLIRNLPVGSRGNVLAPATSLDVLKQKHVRTILLVTDITGSGKQVIDYRDFLYRNKTLKSWHSRKWIRFSVITYCASPVSLQRFSRLGFQRVAYCRVEPTIDTAPWTAEQRQAIRALCAAYAPLRSKMPFGFRRDGGLYAFQESIPNTLPAIVRRQDSSKWHGLLDGKEVDVDLSSDLPPSLVPIVTARHVLDAVHQQRASISIERQMTARNRVLLQALGMLNDHRNTDAELSTFLSLSGTEASLLIDYLMRIGWIDHDRALTDRGRAELQLGKRAIRAVTDRHSGQSKDPYYPEA